MVTFASTLKHLVFIFFFTCCAFASEISLKEKLAEAEPGSYLVTEQNKIFTFLHVYEKTEHSIVLEEVCIPAAKFARSQLSWKSWFEKGAPGHTGWTLSQINLDTGALEEIYSFPHEGWIDISQADRFMTTLLNLKFKELPDNQRRRIGLPPGYGKPDYRHIWHPRLIVDGALLPNISFSAWKARWPSDGSELSRKVIEAYLPETTGNKPLNYPTYFPFWLEVEGKIGSAKVRVIDSGIGVHSTKPRLPRRAPQLIGNGSLQTHGLSFQLKSPLYFHEFVIIAEETDSCLGKTFVLPCNTTREGEVVNLFVANDDMEKLMLPGEHYLFSISPKDDLSLCVETNLPLTFR